MAQEIDQAPISQNTDIIKSIENKYLFFYDVIQKTILHVQQNKTLDIIGISEVGNCIDNLNKINDNLKQIKKIIDKNNTNNDNQINSDEIINILQQVNNDLSTLFKNFGTQNFEDFLLICLGNNLVNNYISDTLDKDKFILLKKYFHPTGYKILDEKYEDTKINQNCNNLDCFDVSIKIKQFYLNVFGIRVVLHNKSSKKTIVVSGITDNTMIDFMDNSFINNVKKELKEIFNLNNENVNENVNENIVNFDRYINTLIMKDYLINSANDLYLKYCGYNSNLNLYNCKTIQEIVKEFISSSLYVKRSVLIQSLIKIDRYDNQYLAYLLYDLLSNNVNNDIDTKEQMMIFDSFSWISKKYFKDSMKKTIQYTNNLLNFDMQKIPLEQQICLMRANENVKEKAMQKLKEVKAKSEDSCSKARQYLDGLLKIPFGIHKKEPILNLMVEIKNIYKNSLKENKNFILENEKLKKIEIKENYTNLEIIKYKNEINDELNKEIMITPEIILSHLNKLTKTEIISFITEINLENLKKIKISNKTKPVLINEMMSYFQEFEINKNFKTKILNENINNSLSTSLLSSMNIIGEKFCNISNYMNNMRKILDESIYGHSKAKKQIERIIGQWINGKQDGYCFGFEGAPGLGKTTLAKKGLSKCLIDDNGEGRPFAMIQMGGDTNGSTLHGHSYTYVGSTWGSIVQILIDKKCMNPIIFIDEVDKISKTEHGREIVGILTHLLDSTQNDCFQDKYFSGIDLDLSKALFILSYNDVDSIDRILLDRIHRIKFNNLTLDEKIVICNKYLLPEIYVKMGLCDMIIFETDVLKFVIDEYTSEAGVRKLKEILFEIISEINLDLLKIKTDDKQSYNIPINININDIKEKYLKDKYEIKTKKIHQENKIGIINGLWANSLGKGGVIPIQSCWRPSKDFLNLQLTGMQGDVMKESMNVALTLAWNLTSFELKNEITQKYQNYGIHIHCPDTSTPKDGPSAGTAITTTIYSLFNNKKIKCDVAITGEICLDGNVTEIGGLDLKFLGGINAGVKEFIYPNENKKDYDKFMEKYKDDEIVKDIHFFGVSRIEEVFELVFE
jgi:ATP-dependent Lon protease